MTIHALTIEVEEYPDSGRTVVLTGPDIGDGENNIYLSIEQLPIVIRELSKILDEENDV